VRKETDNSVFRQVRNLGGKFWSLATLRPGLTSPRTYEDQIIDFIDFFVEDKLGKPVEWDPATSSFIVMFGINDVVSRI
jgi:hypothetical protein